MFTDDSEHYQGSAGTYSGEEEAERVIFHGTPSQWMNFNTFFRDVLFFTAALSAPAAWNNFIAPFFSDVEQIHDFYLLFFKVIFFAAPAHMFWVWLKTHFHRYTVTTERLSEGYGVFNRNTEELELYRVKDISMYEPFSLRMFGLSDVVLSTSDTTTPVVVVHGIREGRKLVNAVRKHTEIMRARKGVREID